MHSQGERQGVGVVQIFNADKHRGNELHPVLFFRLIVCFLLSSSCWCVLSTIICMHVFAWSESMVCTCLLAQETRLRCPFAKQSKLAS